MNYADVLNNARQCIGQYCKACPVCNGVACKNQIPGPGAKGVGDTAIRNYNKWAEIRVNMDTLCENGTPDTGVELFGKTFKYPFFAGPVGAVNLHYSDTYTDMTYNDVLVRACAENGIAAFTGDGTNPTVMEMATKAIGAANGCGVPTIKPWNIDTIKEKMAQAKASGCFAVAMDVDAAGLPFLKNMTPPAGSKSVAELAEIVKLAERPFIVKGVMTVKGALKAKQAGAAAIVVSNHGGRVLDQCPATAEVLPEIARRADRFLRWVETQWMKESKGFGFEVQDIRIAGVASRARSAARRVSAYLNGEVAALEELEAERLYFDCREDDGERKITACNNWALNVSGAVI